MKIVKLLLLALALSLFSSCVSVVPQKANTSGSLVILISESTVDDPNDIFVSFDIVYDTDKTIRLTPTTKYSIVETIGKGTHTINAVRTLNTSSTESTKESKINMDFVVEDGKVTIFPLKFLLTKKIDGNSIYLYSGFSAISNQDIAQTKNFFYQQKNSAEWKFLEAN